MVEGIDILVGVLHLRIERAIEDRRNDRGTEFLVQLIEIELCICWMQS
jgi:hypothetical protein